MMNEFEQRVNLVIKGMRLADKYCSYDESIFYLILNRHLGDAVRTLQVCRSIKDYYGEQASKVHSWIGAPNVLPAKRKCIKRLNIITTEAIAGVAKLYADDINEIIILERNELKALEAYALSSCSMHQNIISDFGARAWVQHNERTDEGTQLRTSMFGVTDLMWELCLPIDIVKRKAKMKVDLPSILEVQKFLHEKGVEANQIILFCPEAKSTSKLDNRLWNMIVCHFAKAGYKLFTNICGEEKALPFTEEIRRPVNFIAALAMQGCRVIGIQSGLMDVLLGLNPPYLYIFNVIRTIRDKQFAQNRGAVQEVCIRGNVTYFRLEHFEEDYVLKLLMDNFH